MGSRKICFEGDDGQYGTCIQEDEDCMKCDTKSRELHYQMIAQYNKNVKISSEEHSLNFSKICDEMEIVRQIIYGLRQLSTSTHVIGLEKLTEDLTWRANTLDDVRETTLALIKKHQHEELLMAQYDVEQLNRVLKR